MKENDTITVPRTFQVFHDDMSFTVCHYQTFDMAASLDRIAGLQNRIFNSDIYKSQSIENRKTLLRLFVLFIRYRGR